MKCRWANRSWAIFFLIYAVFGLINLDTLPVAWTDEILNLDPAVQHLITGEYRSAIWPNPNSDLIFAGYLPLIQWVHHITLSLLPLEIFWVRLPFFLLSLLSLVLFKQLLQIKIGRDAILLTLLTIIVFLDKTIFELNRSMRVEPLLIFFTLFYLYLKEKNQSVFLRFLLLGFLWMGHLYVWPLVLAFVINEVRLSKIKQSAIGLVVFLIPSILFLSQLNWEITPIKEQLFHQVAQHRINETDLKSSPLMNSIWFRFYPHYKEQPLMPMIYLASILSVFYILIKNISLKKWNAKTLYYLGFTGMLILIFVFMTPQYRYLPLLLILGILWAPFKLNHRLTTIILVLLCGNLSLSFLGRHTAALAQRESRNPLPVFDFLHKHIEGETPLILGESIGYYYAYRDIPKNVKRLTYGLNFYPQHQDWSQHDKVYLLTKKVRKNEESIAYYKSKNETWELPKWAKKFAKGGTYDGIYIYLLKN
jgi:hypothetical protein